MNERILITGGSGVLGKELIWYCQTNLISNYAPSSKVCNILDYESVYMTILNYRPTHIIHAAAFVDTQVSEFGKKHAIDPNVNGTINVVGANMSTGVSAKFIYISTEYVFDGKKGNYTIDDRLNPINTYGKTKAAGEYIASTMYNYQIIRAPFIRKQYKEVFTDQYCSRYFVDEVADKIVKNALFNDEKIVHISTERKSLFDIQKQRNPDIIPITIPENYKNILPYDTSLVNTNKF